MDLTAFRTWLNGIPRLDASQREQAMRALALAEAGIPAKVQAGVTATSRAETERVAAPRRPGV